MLAKVHIIVFILSVLGCIGVAGMWTYSSNRWVHVLTDALPETGGVSFCMGITNVHWGEVAEIEFLLLQVWRPKCGPTTDLHRFPTRHLVGESQRMPRLILKGKPWFQWTAGTPRRASDTDYRSHVTDSSLVFPTWYFLVLYLPGLLWSPLAAG